MLCNCPNADKFNSTTRVCNGNRRRRRWRRTAPLPGPHGCRKHEQPAPRTLHLATFLPNLQDLKQSQVNLSTRASISSNGKATKLTLLFF